MRPCQSSPRAPATPGRLKKRNQVARLVLDNRNQLPSIPSVMRQQTAQLRRRSRHHSAVFPSGPAAHSFFLPVVMVRHVAIVPHPFPDTTPAEPESTLALSLNSPECRVAELARVQRGGRPTQACPLPTARIHSRWSRVCRASARHGASALAGGSSGCSQCVASTESRLR